MILDTCALLWLAQRCCDKLSNAAWSSINNAMDVYISAVTGFEIGIKCNAGKLELPAPPQQWLDIILQFHHIEVIPLSLAICTFSTELPAIHKDPCDRFIIATALNLKMPVVTVDKRFPEYGVDIVN